MADADLAAEPAIHDAFPRYDRLGSPTRSAEDRYFWRRDSDLNHTLN
jgi:hypothetical protein